MSTQAAKRHAAREKRRRLLERVALVALAALLVFSAMPVGRAFWGRLYTLSGFRGPVEAAPLEIHFIDVGKADAILLRCQGQAALLDAGTYASGDRVVDYLRRMGVERLEYAIASHPDSDHTGGMAQVLEEIPVEALVVYPWPDEMRQTLEYRALEEASFSCGVPVKTVGPGDSLPLGETSLEVLGPLEEYEETNDCSLVLRLDYLGFSALFCGDIEAQAELDLVKSGAALDADLLKVAHHGSASSSSRRFLEAVTPAYAVVSVGPDNSNLPREETLLRLESVGAEIYRTDTDGDLVFSWDGEELSLWSEFYNTVERTEEKP